MMSKNSFLQISKWNFQKRTPYLFFCFIACFFFMPVNVFVTSMNYYSSLQDAFGQGGVFLEGDISWIASMLVPQASFSSFFGVLLCIVMAITFAITAFSWNNSIQKVDFYKSLPVKEKTRFFYIHFNSVIMFVLCFGINLILSNLAVAYFGFYTKSYLMASVISFFYHLLFFLAVYFLACIAQLITGNSVLATFGAIFFIFFEPFLALLFEALESTFYHTFLNTSYAQFGALGNGFLTPISAFAKGYLMVNDLPGHFLEISNYKPLLQSCVLLIVQILCYLILAYVLYIRRSPYAGNEKVTFQIVKPIMKILMMLTIVPALGYLFYELSNYSFKIATFGLISGVFLTQIVMQFVLEGEFKKVIKGIPSCFIGAVISVLFFAYCPMMQEQYDQYIPNIEKVDSVAIARGDENTKDYFNESFNQILSDKYILDRLCLTEESVIEQLCGAIKKSQQEHIYENSRYGYEVDCENLSVCFNLKNGKKVKRYYILEKEQVRALFDTYYESGNYREIASSVGNEKVNEFVLNLATHHKMAVYIAAERDFVFSTKQEDLSKELYMALLEDVPKRTLYTITTEIPIGEISVFAGTEDMEEMGMHHLLKSITFRIPFYESDETIMKLLADKVELKSQIDPDMIDRIEVSCDLASYKKAQNQETSTETKEVTEMAATEEIIIDKDEYMIDSTVTYTKDMQDFEAVLKCAYFQEAVYHVVDSERLREPYFYGIIHLTNGEAVSCYFKKGELPKEIRDSVIVSE